MTIIIQVAGGRVYIHVGIGDASSVILKFLFGNIDEKTLFKTVLFSVIQCILLLFLK